MVSCNGPESQCVCYHYQWIFSADESLSRPTPLVLDLKQSPCHLLSLEIDVIMACNISIQSVSD
jgi:hypothetical protein